MPSISKRFLRSFLPHKEKRQAHLDRTQQAVTDQKNTLVDTPGNDQKANMTSEKPVEDSSTNGASTQAIIKASPTLNRSQVSLFLHDDSRLTVQTVVQDESSGANGSTNQAVTLTLKHHAGDGKSSEWTVLASFAPSCTTFDDSLTVQSENVPSSREYTKWLWFTLYWYFQLPRPSVAAGTKPGLPKREWGVSIRGSIDYKEFLYEAERVGLIFSSTSSAQRVESETFYTLNKAFWQIPPDAFYQSNGSSGNLYASHPHPLQFSLPTTNGRHPLRPKPPSPGATFYKRYIPSLNSFLTFRTVSLESDVPILHKWMNNPRVDAFWGEAGPDTHQREFLRKGLEDKHCFPVIASWRDLSETDSANGGEGASPSGVEEPFGYFEIYWVKEDRLAAYTETGDWDRGVHVLVGEEKFRGQHRVKAWLSSLIHFMFLSDPRTMTLMLEPRVDNDKFINYLCKAGFYKEKEFAFPHKQAAVMKLKREAWDGPVC